MELTISILMIALVIAVVAFISLFRCYKREKITALLLLGSVFMFYGFWCLMEILARVCGDLALAKIFFWLGIIIMPLIYLFLMGFITMTREYKPSLRFYLYLIFISILEVFRAIGEFDVSFVDGSINRTDIVFNVTLLGQPVNVPPVFLLITTIWVFSELVYLIISQLRIVVTKIKRDLLFYTLIALFIAFLPILVQVGIEHSPELKIISDTLSIFLNVFGIAIIAWIYIQYPYLVYLLPQRVHAVLVGTKEGLPCYTHIFNEEMGDDLILLSGFFSAIHEFGRIITHSGSLQVIQFENLSVIFSISSDYMAALLISHVLPAHINIAKQMVKVLNDISISNVKPSNLKKQIESQIQPLLEPILP